MIFALPDVARIAFVTEGGPEVGLGHVKRCRALALRLARAYPRARIEWLCDAAPEGVSPADLRPLPEGRVDSPALPDAVRGVDLLILDSYRFDEGLLRSLREVARTVLFDDALRLPVYPVDFVLNGHAHAHELAYRGEETVFLLGPDYLYLSPEYEEIAYSAPEPESLLVSVGAADAEGFMPRLVSMLAAVPARRIRVIQGPFFPTSSALREACAADPRCELIEAPPSLLPALQASETVLCTSGTTAYEALKCERRLICFQTAANQVAIGRSLARQGRALDLGWYTGLTGEVLLAAWRRGAR